MQVRSRITFLIFPRFQLLDAAGPIAAFEAAGKYELLVCATTPGPVSSSSGVSWIAAALPRDPGSTLVVVGGEGVDAAMRDEILTRYIRRAHAAHVRVASICSGSLLLAAAGVLDHREATSHWSRTAQFRRDFPLVRFNPDRIYVEEGHVWTSAGVTAGIDLALAIIARDAGAQLARSVAQELVVYYRRPGGQSQFSALLSMQAGDGRFDAVLDHVRQHLKKRHSVEDLAALASMSARHFARAFREDTGVTPAKAVERIRVEAARNAFVAGEPSVQAVANACGFGTAEHMRRSFLRVFGAPPSVIKRPDVLQ